ncbi:uncharacterized protein [Choristoneura fumiferana]|uniref:uncharacterized protein n=1 Tax=Choristoneura fumiferana TaxID=7141 RepID=UPI003D153807
MSGSGKFAEFDIINGNWTSYCERLDMCFLANGVKDELKLPTLIANVGESAYELIVNLCSPDKPSTLTYEKVVKLVKDHLQPVPSALAERYKFRQCRQENGQSLADYVAILKQKARFCDFGKTLEENLRDQLVCGITSDAIRQRLFAENKLDYSKAVSLAATMESAERNASAVESPAFEMHYSATNKRCTACGDRTHVRVECKFRDYVCDKCSKVGHLRRVCPEGEGQRARQEALHEHEKAWGRGYRSGQAVRGQIDRAPAGRGQSARGRRRRGVRGGAALARHYCIQEQHEASAGRSSRDGADETSTGGFNEGALNQRRADYSDDEMPMYQMGLSDYRPI